MADTSGYLPQQSHPGLRLKPSEIAIARLPRHLAKYIVPQNYDAYTPRDQAVWRYLMRVVTYHLQPRAHKIYLRGLEAAGIGTEQIPSIDEMNMCLNKIGWSAVCVRGYIPPKVYMELQSLGVMAMAVDVRSHEHVSYAPAPDLFHETAGHAPIIYDEAYAAYVKEFGRVGMRAISYRADRDIYDAMRNLSIAKEGRFEEVSDVDAAESALAHQQAVPHGDSEATRLSRMHFWTTEFGLIGSMNHPKVFGAGLLSSIKESEECTGDGVAKIPLSGECTEMDYHISKPQSQLFVAEDFEDLRNVLGNFENTMAYRRGGLYGMQEALASEDVTTTVLDTGLQISGTVSKLYDEFPETVSGAIWQSGSAGIAVEGKMLLLRHDVDHHCMILGKLKSGQFPFRRELVNQASLHFDFLNGFQVKGKVIENVQVNNLCRGAVLENATILAPDGNVLLSPKDGPVFLALGQRVNSVYGGPADRDLWDMMFSEPHNLEGYGPHEPPSNDDPAFQKLMSLYAEVRAFRQSGRSDVGQVLRILSVLRGSYPGEWLLPLEIIEILNSDRSEYDDLIREEIERMQFHIQWPDFKRGLEVLGIKHDLDFDTYRDPVGV